MSNLIRANALAVLEHRDAAAPRVFGGRVVRGDHVGLRRPISLSVPVGHSPAPATDAGPDEPAEPVRPDLAAVEEAARMQGYDDGFEAGRAAGMVAVEQAMSEQVSRLSVILSQVHENHASFFRAAERQVVDLALQIAQKVVERELENMPDMAVNVIRAALEEMDARTVVRVRVNPDDVELLRRQWTQVVPTSVGPDRVELQPDERVSSGGAVIETTHGQVDAQLESKLAQLGNALWTFVVDVSSKQDEVELGDA